MTNEKMVLKVQKRDVLGKKSKVLRQKGLSIGNIVISGKDSVPVSMDALDLKRIYEKAGESSLVYLTLEGQKSQIPVLLKEVDFDPLQGEIFHVVFLKVSLKEKVEASIPLEFEGEFKVNGASLVKVKDTVDISALPTDLPEHFIVNLELLTEAGDQITLADVKIDESIIEVILPEDTSKSDVVLAIAQLEAEEQPEETDEDTDDSEDNVESSDEKAGEEKAE
ncbi:MAG: 50S ribosomal protein L25 [Candidatus Pacebacteria bacterium]|nr:50S ribosomal protein L25 [Candidatus Paceibacterota bacterium]